MKHDAIVEQGIPIHERVPIPEEMIPEDSRVEIDAKIQAGYCRFSFSCHSSVLMPRVLRPEFTNLLLPNIVEGVR
jgi:hypothetical protein